MSKVLSRFFQSSFGRRPLAQSPVSSAADPMDRERHRAECCPQCGGDASDNWFDRSLCPCDDIMHTRCRNCGAALDSCSFDTDEAPASSPKSPVPPVETAEAGHRPEYWSSAAEAAGREGMVTVWDDKGGYVGCMGKETWQSLLVETAEERAAND